MMNTYELVLILSKDTPDEVSKIEDVLAKIKAKIDKKDKWGKKALAYLIDSKKEGCYYQYMISCDPKTIKNLPKQFDLNRNILRYLLLKL